MNEKWVALAQQIADLQRQVEVLTTERNLYKAMYDLRDAQMRKTIVTAAPADDVIEINLKELTK